MSHATDPSERPGSLEAIVGRLRGSVDRSTAGRDRRRLIAVPSPTGRAGPVADELASLLEEEGFAVDRPAAGHPDAPAVVVRLEGHRAGRARPAGRGPRPTRWRRS